MSIFINIILICIYFVLLINHHCYYALCATTTKNQQPPQACKKQQEAKDRKRILKYYTCTSRERLIHSGRVYIIYVHALRAYKNTNKALGTRVYIYTFYKKLLKNFSISIFSIIGIFYNNFLYFRLF